MPVYVNNFTEPTGPAVDIPDTARGVFELYFDYDLIQYIVDETNRYACELMGEEKYEKWEELELNDMYAYFGIMIMMGLVSLPSLHDYWKRDSLFYCPAIAQKMTRDRFLEIHRYLHFTDNTKLIPPEDPQYDRLGKVRRVLDMLQERFLAVYHSNRECAIDEAMVPYKGRSSLKQYMPKKPIRRGLKVWMRADSCNGYVSRFQVYVGKEVTSEKGLGARVVKDLSRDLIGKHYHIFCDNFFTSIRLFDELHQKGIYATGTLRADRRGFPEELRETVKKGFRERGESESCHCTVNNSLTVSVWQDTRPVTVCSTYCQTVPLDEVQRKMKNGEHNTYPCPHSVTTYNRYMGGVDRNDQMREYYNVRLKSRKYYKYLFWMLFDVTITNTLIMSRANPVILSDTRTSKAFRTTLAHQLLQGYCSRKYRGRRPSSIPTKKFKPTHFPLLGDGRQHRCYYCSLQGKRSDTKWYCDDCKLYFCHKGSDTECFLQYHIHHCQ